MMMGHYDEYYEELAKAARDKIKRSNTEKDDASYREFLRNMKRYKEGNK